MKCVSPEPVDAATVNIEGGQVVELSSEGLDQIAHGYGMVLTSTQVDEDAQHFYRKLGYKDCGGLTVVQVCHRQTCAGMHGAVSAFLCASLASCRRLHLSED